jgi:hypothetical protein
MMLHRIEIYREPYSLAKDKTSEFKLNLLQRIESEDLSAVVDFGIDFMRSNFEFADLSADDINVGSFICSDPSGLNNSVKEDALRLLYRYLVGDLYSFIPITFFDKRIWSKVSYIIKYEELTSEEVGN